MLSDVMVSPSPQRDLWWELFVPVQRFCGSLVLVGLYYNQHTEEKEHIKNASPGDAMPLAGRLFRMAAFSFVLSFEWNTTFSVCFAFFVPVGSSASSNTPVLNMLTRFPACPNRETEECLKNLISVVYFPYQVI